MQAADIARLQTGRRLRLRRWAQSAAVVTGLLAAGAIGVASAKAGEDISASTTIVLAIATIAVASYPIARRVASGRLDVFEPVVASCVMLGVLFGARPVANVIARVTTYPDGSPLEPMRTTVGLLGFVCTLLFVVAYELVTAWFRSRPAETVSKEYRGSSRSAYEYGLIISLVGLGLFAVFLQQAGSVTAGVRLLAAGGSDALQDVNDASSEYLVAAPIAAACAAIVVILVAGRSLKSRDCWYAAIAVMIPVLVNFSGGTRRFIIPSIAIPIICHYLCVGRRPAARRVWIVIAVSAITLSALPYARTVGAREQNGGLFAFLGDSFSHPLRPLTDFITGPDTDMINGLSVEINTLQSSGNFAWGKATVGDLVIAPIPHVLYAGKPATARNELLTEAFGSPCDAVGGFCPDFSVVGTFFQDAGYAGALVGMLLLGGGSAALWQRFLRRQWDPYAALLAASCAVFLPIVIRAGFMPAFAWALYFVVPSAFGLWIAGTRRSRGERQRASSERGGRTR